MVTVHRSAMEVFRLRGEHAALMLGRTTDLRQAFASCSLGACRGPRRACSVGLKEVRKTNMFRTSCVSFSPGYRTSFEIRIPEPP